MKVLSVFLGFIFSATGSFAQNHSYGQQEIPSYYEQRLYHSIAKKNEKMVKRCDDCTFANSPDADRSCQARYDKVFSKPEVNIHIAFGYMDSSEGEPGYYGGFRMQRNQSVDQTAAEGLIQELTGPCWFRSGSCGFQRDPSNSEVVYKTMDYDGRRVRVKVRVTYASETPYYGHNLTSNKEAQRQRTLRSEQNFLGTLGESDLTIYKGHARGGGGPDFSPPILKGDQTPDYSHYRATRPGIKKLISALNQTKQHPSLLAIVGCKTGPYFGKPLTKAGPKMGLITTTDLIYFEDGFQHTFVILDAFLKRECASTFQRSLDLIRGQNGARAILTNF